jgi:uncharacterized protein (UPF0212 family)
MFRKMLKLAVEAAKVEIDHWKTPAPALVEPVVEHVPAINEAVEVAAAVRTPDLRWQSPAFHMETLRSTTCPDCGEEKRVGWYRCSLCIQAIKEKSHA